MALADKALLRRKLSDRILEFDFPADSPSDDAYPDDQPRCGARSAVHGNFTGWRCRTAAFSRERQLFYNAYRDVTEV